MAVGYNPKRGAAAPPPQALFPDLAAECVLLPRAPGGGGGGAAALVDPARYHSSVRRASDAFVDALIRSGRRHLFILKKEQYALV